MPSITIRTGALASVDSEFERLRAELNSKYHNYKLSEGAERMSKGMSEAQKGAIESGSAYASHAGDGGASWVHIERLIC